MSVENVKILKRIKSDFKKALNEQDDEVGEKLFNDTRENLENIIQTKDEDVLPGLFDLFILEDLEYTGVCESLENDIFRCFEWGQIFKILKKKMEKLMEFNSLRAMNFASSCDIEDLKELIQEIPSSKVKEFLTKLKDSCREDLSEDIKLLLEDM